MAELLILITIFCGIDVLSVEIETVVPLCNTSLASLDENYFMQKAYNLEQRQSCNLLQNTARDRGRGEIQGDDIHSKEL